MPKFLVQTIVEYRVQADSPEHARSIIEDGESKLYDVVDAWVEKVYDRDGVTKVWPQD